MTKTWCFGQVKEYLYNFWNYLYIKENICKYKILFKIQKKNPKKTTIKNSINTTTVQIINYETNKMERP